MGLFSDDCDHDWKIVTDKEISSPAEQMDLANRNSRGKVPHWMFKKKSITILKCSKCGKLDKTIENFNPW